MMMRSVFTALVIVLIATTAQAGDIPPPTTEYDNVPPGLLLTPAQRLEITAPDQAVATKPDTQNTDSLDPQVLTHSLKVLEDKPIQTDQAKIIGMPQIEQAYAQGKYADIIHPLEENVAQNDAQAALLLGVMFDAGQGVTANPQRATELFARAAEANVSQAQHRLALQYYQGRGVAKDSLRAMMWLHIAAVTFKDGPQKDRAVLDRNNLDAALSRRDRETAVFMAREWLTKKGIAHLLDADTAPAQQQPPQPPQ